MEIPFVDGVMLALAVVASVGPVSLKCLYSGLVFGRRSVVVAGLGGGTVHGLFAALAGTAAGSINVVITEHEALVRSVSALVILYLGIRVLLKRPPSDASAKGGGLRAAYLSTAMLALTNPTTLLPYAAAATTLTNVALTEPSSVLLLAAGAASGATSWYLTIGCLATLVPRALTAGILPRLNIVAGTAQIGFGLLIYFR